ncbi:MAG TPA: glycosyltransferase family 9 protein [Candidatus Solibacter sp.]|nr:glycosyltransferase family 9 protein [Candidatus Solibacter sp.]
MRRLVIRPGAIGDFIVSLPALESLRTDYLEVWTHRRTVELVRFANRVRAIDSTGIELAGITQGPPPELAGFDDIVSWYGTNRPDFRDAVRGLPFRFFPALPHDAVEMHATDFYLAQLDQPLGGIPRIQCDARSDNFAVIHPFSGSARKNWPLDKFRGVARQLETRMPVRWCSGADDPPLPNAIRIDNLWELASWLASARVYLGNDSGITHLAAAVGTPTLAIFGLTDPDVWAPRGPHVRVVRAKMEAKG